MSELDPKEKYIARDLSWLSFNERVLEEATDMNNPLLERARFMAIAVSNLDEFFMVRVANVKAQLDGGFNNKDDFGYYPHELFSEIRTRTEAFIQRLYAIYGKFRKETEKNKIFIKTAEELNNEQKRFTKRFFESTLYPIITPMAVDQAHPFPVLPSRTLAFAVSLKKGESTHFAIIPIPQNVSRVLRLPSETDENSFILTDEILRQNIKTFFKGYTIEGLSLFRVIRDSELAVEEDVAPNLLKAVEKELKKRLKARAVYLEIEKSCPQALMDVLCESIEFPKEEALHIDGDLDLSYLFDLIGQTNRPELLYQSFIPGKIPYENIFDKINEGDFIIHAPYQSFFPTVDLIQSAAKDENVLAIKMTLYRTNEDSGIIKGLKEAAKNRKQVTVLVEIKARFDEEKNINWVKELEEAGCHVIYGVSGLKIHSKMTLIVRKVEGGIRRYVHLSTGNYNEKTAKIYTDIGYFTANDDFARDISDVFNVITGYSVPSPWKRIIASPNDLRKYFFDLIDQEIDFQKKYKNGSILAKLNSLEDPKMIDKLYEASSAGVKVKLIVRGICCLVPGVPNLSDNIEVKSIVGRFLEHSRIFVFHNNASPRVFLASSDWMRRNFDRRIELLFEIYKDEIKDHLQQALDMQWRDNQKARVLLPDKTYGRIKEGEKSNAQEQLIKLYSGWKA